MKKLILFIASLFFLAVTPHDLSAHGGRSLLVHGLGITLDYDHGLGKQSATDWGFGINYRNGFFYMVSGFITADVSWRQEDKSLNAKLGIQGMIVFLGLETGLICKYEVEKPEQKTTPGIFFGFAGFLPVDDFSFPFFSIGTNIYLIRRETEFYASLTLFFNLSSL